MRHFSLGSPLLSLGDIQINLYGRRRGGNGNLVCVLSHKTLFLLSSHLNLSVLRLRVCVVDTMGQEIEIHPVNQLAISCYVVTYMTGRRSRRPKEVNSIPDM